MCGEWQVDGVGVEVGKKGSGGIGRLRLRGWVEEELEIDVGFVQRKVEMGGRGFGKEVGEGEDRGAYEFMFHQISQTT